MRTLILFATVISMSTLTPAQTLPVPQAITDPKQITSKPNAQVEQNQQSLSIERLYMTRSVGATAWSPDGKTIAFVSNISGRNNIWLVPCRGRMAYAAYGQRPAPDFAGVVARRKMDRLHFRLRRRRAVGYFLRLAEDRAGGEHHQHAGDFGGESRWSPDGRYLAYTVKPKTSSVYEIDIFDTLMRDTKHLTTGTPKDKMNVNPIWSADGK